MEKQENKRPINELLSIAMESLNKLIDVNVIVGDQIISGETSIIPICKVKCGYLSGGIDQKKNKNYEEFNPFGGGAGGTITITPVAFLTINKDEVKLLHLEENSHILEKAIDFIPDTIQTIINSIKKKNDKKTYNIDKI